MHLIQVLVITFASAAVALALPTGITPQVPVFLQVRPPTMVASFRLQTVLLLHKVFLFDNRRRLKDRSSHQGYLQRAGAINIALKNYAASISLKQVADAFKQETQSLAKYPSLLENIKNHTSDIF
jgi:hypothetical protein